MALAPKILLLGLAFSAWLSFSAIHVLLSRGSLQRLSAPSTMEVQIHPMKPSSTNVDEPEEKGRDASSPSPSSRKLSTRFSTTDSLKPNPDLCSSDFSVGLIGHARPLGGVRPSKLGIASLDLAVRRDVNRVFFLGDAIPGYDSRVTEQWNNLRESCAERGVTSHFVVGNHEAGALVGLFRKENANLLQAVENGTVSWLDAQRSTMRFNKRCTEEILRNQAVNGCTYYSVVPVMSSVRFIVLNTVHVGSPFQIAGKQMQFLKAEVSKGKRLKQRMFVLVQHLLFQEARKPGHWGGPGMKDTWFENVHPVLADGGVLAVIAGDRCYGPELIDGVEYRGTALHGDAPFQPDMVEKRTMLFLRCNCTQCFFEKAVVSQEPLEEPWWTAYVEVLQVESPLAEKTKFRLLRGNQPPASFRLSCWVHVQGKGIIKSHLTGNDPWEWRVTGGTHPTELKREVIVRVEYSGWRMSLIDKGSLNVRLLNCTAVEISAIASLTPQAP